MIIEEKVCALHEGIDLIIFNHKEYTGSYYECSKELIDSNKSVKDFITQNLNLDVKASQGYLDLLKFENPLALDNLLFIPKSDFYYIHSSAPNLMYAYCLNLIDSSVRLMHERTKTTNLVQRFDVDKIYYSCMRIEEVHRLLYSGIVYPKATKQILEANYNHFHVSAGDGYIIDFGEYYGLLNNFRKMFKIDAIRFI
jgi:hypothetical protein